MTDQPPFSLRSIALPALLPTLLFSIGEGAILPIIPLMATDLGAGLALAGLIAAMVMLGQLVGDIPSGWVIARIGERRCVTNAASVAARRRWPLAGISHRPPGNLMPSLWRDDGRSAAGDPHRSR